jgi:hypothetical protein
MRAILRTIALALVILVLLVPMVAYAKGKPRGPCPDDPVASKNCNPKTPPYYVVINRYEQHLTDRPGTGCQPFILKHPTCKDCTNAADPACSAIDVDVEVCQAVMAPKGMPAGDVYELCCNCATDPKGSWVYRIRKYDGKSCPNPSQWYTGLPPGTGIDLPAPVIVGGLAAIGAGFLTVGLLVRRRSLRTA